MTETKRKVHPLIRKILDFDAYITNKFVSGSNRILPASIKNTVRLHYKGLEISCHGIPWFAFWIAFTWLFNNPNLVQLQVNMLLGLFLDIIFIAVAKAYFRRKRPVKNSDDALGQIGPDVFSFPSGHASRSVFVAYFFLHLWPLPIICYPPILAWVTAICISRILMNRHYILDVVGGCALGLFNGILMEFLWIEDSTARYLVSWISDEKLDGGDYHV